MSDEIFLKRANDTTIATIPSDTVTLTFSSTGGSYSLPYYNSELVDKIEAELESDLLTIVASGSGFTVNDIRATASGADVSSFLNWGTNPANNAFELKMTTPDNTDEWMEWKFGATVPPIKLKVKIVRR